MQIGTGIFLGCVALALVYLYVKTRGVWNWKKISLLAVSVPTVLIMLFGGYIYFEEEWSQRTKIITKIGGISLGDKLNDLVFKFGDFEPIKSDSERDPGEVSYESPIKNLQIIAKGDVVKSVVYFCKQETSDYTSINRVSCGDSGEDIIQKFPDSVRMQCSKKEGENDKFAKFVRAYDTVNYGVRYILANNKVVGFFIANPEDLKSYVGKNWVKCE